jgi:hypothetical protein
MASPCVALRINLDTKYMKIVKQILLILFFFKFTTLNAQKVSNIALRQEQSNIIVSYDLDTKDSCKISLFVSTDD